MRSKISPLIFALGALWACGAEERENGALTSAASSGAAGDSVAQGTAGATRGGAGEHEPDGQGGSAGGGAGGRGGSDGAGAGGTANAGSAGTGPVEPSCASPSEPAASGNALSALAAALQPGEWRELPTAGLEQELLYTDAAGDSGSTAHTDWSDELSWDPTTETAYYLGAGHLRPFGFVRYEAASNTWCRQDQGLPSCMYVGGYDGCFSHGYDQGALDPTRHVYYFNSWLRLFAYDTSVKTWTEHALPEGSPVGYGGVLEYFPPADKLFVFIGGDAVLNTVGGESQSVATALATGPYHNVATYSPLHRKLIFGGGNGSGRLYELDESLNVTQVPDEKGLPDGVPNLAHVGMTTLTADPVSGDVLFLSTALTFHAYDPGARVWRHLADPPFRDFAEPAENVANGQVEHHVLAVPIDSYGVVLFVLPQGRYKTFVYKHG